MSHLVYLVDQSMNLPEPQCSPPLLPLAYNCESLMGWYVRVVSTLDPLGLALGSPIFPSGGEGKLVVALESLQGRRALT